MTNEQIYAAIKGAFVSKRTTLNQWCKINNIHRQNVRAAIMGEWKGEKASQLVNLVIVESGVSLDGGDSNAV